MEWPATYKEKPTMNVLSKRFFTGLLAAFLGVMLVTTLLVNDCSAYVYWTNWDINAIARANLDGTGVDQSWIEGCWIPWGIAVDENYVYWSNALEIFGSIGRANLDGTGADPFWITWCSESYGVAVDQGHVYWPTYYPSNTVGQANLASKPTTVAGSMAAFTFRNPAWAALDASVTKTYAITPMFVSDTTNYQPTLRFTISNTLLLRGTAGSVSSYFFSLNPPTVTLVEP